MNFIQFRDVLWAPILIWLPLGPGFGSMPARSDSAMINFNSVNRARGKKNKQKKKTTKNTAAKITNSFSRHFAFLWTILFCIKPQQTLRPPDDVMCRDSQSCCRVSWRNSADFPNYWCQNCSAPHFATVQKGQHGFIPRKRKERECVRETVS